MDETQILDGKRCPTCRRKYRVRSKLKLPPRQVCQPEPDRLPMIQGIVAEFFAVPLPRLISTQRTQHISFVRQVAMYLCRKLTDASFPEIGLAFHRDHSTVIHAYNLISRRVTNDFAFGLSIEKIERLCDPNRLTWAQFMPMNEEAAA